MCFQAKLIFIFSLQIFGGKCFECGTTIYPHAPDHMMFRIIGGVTSKPGAWPWMAALYAPSYGDLPDFKCGGSLISDRLVVTAAHCSFEEIYLVRLGVNNLDTSVDYPSDYSVKKMIVHENFDSSNTTFDIAVILLNRRVVFTDRIKPICLPRGDIFQRSNFEGTSPFVVGWGDTVAGEAKGSWVLREVQLPIVNLLHCRKVYNNFSYTVTDQNLCAGLREGGKDACQGDSGGPLMIKSESAFYLIGIVSFGSSCALPDVPGVFTRLDSYLPWIDVILERVRSARMNKTARMYENQTQIAVRYLV